MTQGDVISREELRSCSSAVGGNTSHRMKFPAVARLAEKLVAGGEKSEERSRKHETMSVCLCVRNVVPHSRCLLPFSQESELKIPFAWSLQDA